MTDLAVSERRIRPIQDAIASSNFKQALQLCEKWSKKGESSERFLALKAQVLIQQPDLAHHDRGVSDTLELCRREPAITDLDALHQLQDNLTELNLQSEEGPKLWGRAAATRPNDEDLLMTWLRRSISESNWLSAQKATMGLRKAFPKDRKYDFWNILMCYLVHEDPSSSERDRKMFGTLAYRMISKAAEAVPADPVRDSFQEAWVCMLTVTKEQLLSPGKAIQTPEELNLLVKIYLSAGHAQEAVQLLRSPTLGLRSKFAEKDIQLVFNLLLESLEATSYNEDTPTFCKELLSDEKYAVLDCLNNERVWNMLLQATKQSKDSSVHQKTREFIQTLMQKHQSSRSLGLANLKFLRAVTSNAESQDALLEACKAYKDLFGAKSFCFDDLRSALSDLDKSLLSPFLDALESRSSDASPETSQDRAKWLLDLKLLYHFRVSASDDDVAFDTLFFQALDLHKKSLKHKDALPEACLLAAVALAQRCLRNKSKGTRNVAGLLQAISLLETCCQKSEDFFPATLLLVRLQLLVGNISLAMMRYKKLSIKNLQWETLGHVITSRISTLHPQQYGHITPSQDTGFNPIEALDVTLTVAENSDRLLSRAIVECLSSSSYVNVVESVQMRSNMEHSLSRQISEIEERRVQRMRGVFDDTSPPRLKTKHVDNRDYSHFSILDTLEYAPKDNLHGAPVQRAQWLAAKTLLETLVYFLKLELSPLPTSWDKVQNVYDEAKKLIGTQCEELTEAEMENFLCQSFVADALNLIHKGTPSDQSKLDEGIGNVKKWLADRLVKSPRPLKIGGVGVPDWNYIHTTFSCLESLQLLTLFIAASSKKPKGSKAKKLTISKDTMGELQKLVTQVFEKTMKDTKTLKDGLNESGVLGQFVDGVLEPDENSSSRGDDHTSLETFCGEMKESWEDALDGILGWRVKWFK